MAHVAFKGSPPNEVTVTNTSDQPVSVKTAIPIDLLFSSAVYNTDTATLTVTARSSDEFGSPELTVVGYGVIPAGGSLTVPDLAFVPAFVTVSSSAGGELTLPIVVEGTPYNPIGVQAEAGEDQTVLNGAQVTLDGTGSTGPISSYQWTQVTGTPVSLVGADTAVATFTAPNIATTLQFSLTVTGPGGPSVDTVSVIIIESAPVPIADAGPDQTVRQGTVVTLSGSASTAPVTFHWEQISGFPVQLIGANTPTPSFTFPKQTGPLVFRLTVTNPGGSSSDTVQITPLPDNLAVTRAEFRTRDSEWRVEGTPDVFGPGVTITIYIGNDTNGLVLTQVSVDALGEWGYREEGAAIQPDGTRTVSIESSSGGRLLAVPITIRQ